MARETTEAQGSEGQRPIKPSEPLQASNSQAATSLKELLNKASCETNTAVFVCLELVKYKPALGEQIQKFVRESMPEFFAELTPESAGGEHLDVELDVMPALRWVLFLHGFRAAAGSCVERG